MELRYRPWTLDFTPDDAGFPAFPSADIINPYQVGEDGKDAFIEWTTDDWDPALRFWTLPYDPQLTQWLQSVDPSLPSIMVAREFGSQPKRWQKERADLLSDGWLEEEDLEWQPDPALRPKDLQQKGKAADAWTDEKKRAWKEVRVEIEQLKQLMEDDRERYLLEIDVQADGLAGYFYSMLGVSAARRPWTVEYINCGLALGNIAYMHYKNRFKRARPSLLCPGLVPPFGPPGHPSFPSGHSFLGHLIALLLLEIPAICQRYGQFTGNDGSPGKAIDPETPPRNPLYGSAPRRSPLLWLSQRLAKNRERLGVHYTSDSMGSRHLAAAIWRALLHETDEEKAISCPTLRSVLAKATAEWPTKLPKPEVLKPASGDESKKGQSSSA
jgi:hypothetical protein